MTPLHVLGSCHVQFKLLSLFYRHSLLGVDIHHARVSNIGVSEVAHCSGGRGRSDIADFVIRVLACCACRAGRHAPARFFRFRLIDMLLVELEVCYTHLELTCSPNHVVEVVVACLGDFESLALDEVACLRAFFVRDGYTIGGDNLCVSVDFFARSAVGKDTQCVARLTFFVEE